MAEQAEAGVVGAISLRRWRRDAKLTRPAAAAALGISERMLAYYEAGDRPPPRAILLAARALAAGLDDDPDAPGDARDRWVELVRNMLDYGRGEPVVGRMLRERDLRGLGDFLRFVRRGPDPDLALTDPALFLSLRAAVTRAQLGGLAHYRLAASARDSAAKAMRQPGQGDAPPVAEDAAGNMSPELGAEGQQPIGSRPASRPEPVAPSASADGS